MDILVAVIARERKMSRLGMLLVWKINVGKEVWISLCGGAEEKSSLLYIIRPDYLWKETGERQLRGSGRMENAHCRWSLVSCLIKYLVTESIKLSNDWLYNKGTIKNQYPKKKKIFELC